MLTVFLMLLCALAPIPLSAELAWVTIDWNPGVCTPACLGTLQNRLSSIYSVSEVEMDPSGIKAKLIWKPNQPFEYKKIESAVAWVGLGIRNLALQVRGTISHDSSNVYLKSIGDETKFQLLQGDQNPNGSGELYTLGNPAAYPLTAASRERLLTAEKTYQVVTAEGYLLMFWRPQLYLIITKLSFEDKTKK